MKRGLFITFEGGEGVGKTSVIKAVSERLTKEGVDFIVTREPGGSRIAEEIRSIILDPKNTEREARTEALLYAASRRQHLHEIVIPALNKGTLVISDRYLDSSLAYQGYARGIGREEVYSINKFAIENTRPDRTFFLDLLPEDGLKRIALHRQQQVDRLDREKLSFHQKVYEGYKLLLQRFPERIIRIDASQTIEQEAEEISTRILKKIHG